MNEENKSIQGDYNEKIKQPSKEITLEQVEFILANTAGIYFGN